jgi:hypothetical protein
MIKPFVFPYRPFPGAGISITRFPLRTQQSFFVLGCSPIVTTEECYIAQGAVINQEVMQSTTMWKKRSVQMTESSVGLLIQDVSASRMLPHKLIISITRI